MELRVAIANIAHHQSKWSKKINLAAKLSSFNFDIMPDRTLTSIGNFAQFSSIMGRSMQ